MSDGKEVKRTIKGLLLEMKISPTSEERILAEENILQMFDDHDRIVAELNAYASELELKIADLVLFPDQESSLKTIAELRAEVFRFSKVDDTQVDELRERAKTIARQAQAIQILKDCILKEDHRCGIWREGRQAIERAEGEKE